MKTFIVLCFMLRLVGSSKGVSVCHTFSFTLKAYNVYLGEVLCNGIYSGGSRGGPEGSGAPLILGEKRRND